MIIAEKTLNAIESAIERDNGTLFKKYEQEILPQMNDAYRSDKSSFRDHLGASQIGCECERKILLDFLHVRNKNVCARMTRLFNRGHLEEGRIISCLKCAGIDVEFVSNNRQFGYKYGLFGGSIDGIAHNVPDVPNDQNVMLEFKTMNDKRFNSFKQYGCEFSDPQYWYQAHTNMYCMNECNNTDFKNCLFICVNKNTDEIFAEIIPIDNKIGLEMKEKALRLVQLRELPQTLKPSKAMFPCKFCEYSDMCFDGVKIENECCRNCQCAKVIDNTDFCCEMNINKYTEECYSPIE